LEAVADFEQLLVDDGVMVLKFFLNITAEQWQDCGEEPATARANAEQVLRATSSPIPWYIVPAEKKWYRDYVIATIVAQTLENSISDSKNTPNR
jgi:polyphosphate kinase 2 (PPK2 family)